MAGSAQLEKPDRQVLRPSVVASRLWLGHSEVAEELYRKALAGAASYVYRSLELPKMRVERRSRCVAFFAE
jgi:hypothetical protein